MSPQPICEGTAVFHGAGSCSALLRGHGLQELVALLAPQPSTSRLFLMATPSPASSSSLRAQCSRPCPAWRRRRRASGAKPCFLRNHIPHPSRHRSWGSDWWCHHSVRRLLWGRGASGGLQAPASAFWPRSEAVPGELGDDSAGGGTGQGSKSRRTRAWW